MCLLLTTDEVPTEYWQILAERRREALKDALDENKKVDAHSRLFIIIFARFSLLTALQSCKGRIVNVVSS
jgi:hypothetical protein